MAERDRNLGKKEEKGCEHKRMCRFLLAGDMEGFLVNQSETCLFCKGDLQLQLTQKKKKD